LESSTTAEAVTPAPAGAAKQVGLNFILVCVFIDMLGIGLAVPVLPVLVGQYVEGRDLQAHWYGILATVFGLFQFLCMPLLGALSDKIGRRPVMLYSMAGMAINFFSTALATSLAMLFIGRVVGGMSSASISVANAYASDITTAETRAKAFGKIGACFGLGFIFGPVIGGFLGDINLHLPFYVAGGLCIVNFLFGYFFVPESLPRERRNAFSWRKANPFTALIALARRVEIRGLVAVFALASLAQILLHTTWVLYTNFRFGWGPKENGLSLFCVGVTAAVVQAGLLGWMLKTFGEVRLSLLGLASGALVYALYGLATQGWMMYVFILMNVLAFGAGPALQAIVSKQTDPKEQGALMGSLQSIGSLAVIIGPLLGASLLGVVSHYPAGDFRIGSVFFLCAGLNLAAVFIAWRYFKSHAIFSTPYVKPGK
jgi:DHA1 family tetracycline resistance protein-like MFS transporter